MIVKTLNDLVHKLKETYPNKIPTQEHTQFYHGTIAGQQNVITYIEIYRDGILQKMQQNNGNRTTTNGGR